MTFFWQNFQIQMIEILPFFRGPWTIADHYLMMRPWHPNFDLFEATIDRVAVWVRLPDLAMEYYDNGVLWKIKNHIRRTLKIDKTTAIGTQGNYEWICVEVDLTKLLLSKFKLRRRIQQITYEGLHLICFQCGQYGHKKENCLYGEMHRETSHESTAMDQSLRETVTNRGVGIDVKTPEIIPEITHQYGLWMVITT